MTTIRARVLLAFLLLGLAVLLAIAGALFLVLRELHRDATSGALAEASIPILTEARGRLRGQAPARNVLRQVRERSGSAVDVFIVEADGTVVEGTGGLSDLPAHVDLRPGGRRGEADIGSFQNDDGDTYAYISTTLTGNQARGSPRALVLARPDFAAALAARDLGRALLVAAFVLLAVGVPLAAWLSRSVSRPLERLAAATAVVGRGELPQPLPLEGPDEVNRASQAFNAMASEVAASRVAQADLLANIRHDLRTPLTVIGGYAAALLDGTATGDAASVAARAIADETARLDRLTADIGDLADLDAGGHQLRVEQLDAADLAREAVARFGAAAAAQGQQVDLQVTGPVPVAADRTALERVLGNLVTNALAAAPRPGGAARIQAAQPAPGEVMLAVADNGPGIPAQALPRIFERFYRADPSRAGAGSGLGLAIVQQLARAHGGRAFAENLAGGGARVGVVLPAVRRDGTS